MDLFVNISVRTQTRGTWTVQYLLFVTVSANRFCRRRPLRVGFTVRCENLENVRWNCLGRTFKSFRWGFRTPGSSSGLSRTPEPLTLHREQNIGTVMVSSLLYRLGLTCHVMSRKLRTVFWHLFSSGKIRYALLMGLGHAETLRSSYRRSVNGLIGTIFITFHHRLRKLKHVVSNNCELVLIESGS